VLSAISSTPADRSPDKVFNDRKEYSGYQDLLAPTHYQIFPDSDLNILPYDQPQSSCQKLLFSATLTNDPGKIKKLNLRDVKYFIVKGSENQVGELESERIEMPASLSVG
jgi:ATP-dependent RNA helicase DDX51/DBP6